MKKIIKLTALVLAVVAMVTTLRTLAALSVSASLSATENFLALDADYQGLYLALENACTKDASVFIFPTQEPLWEYLDPERDVLRTDTCTAYLLDHPEEMRFTCVQTTPIPLVGVTVGIVHYDRSLTDEQERQGLEAAEQLCQELEGLSPCEQVESLYRYLTATVTYAVEDNVDHTMYGALVDQDACCEGVAKAMSWCLSRLGIENRIIAATMPTGNGHAWNSLKLDGVWYEFDPTWDLGREPESWKYYMAEELHPDAERLLAC